MLFRYLIVALGSTHDFYSQSSAFPLIIKLKIQYIQRLQYYVKVISELLGLKRSQ